MSNKNQLVSWKQQLSQGYKKYVDYLTDGNSVQTPYEVQVKAKAELGFALQIFQDNPKLQGCDPNSIINAVVNVARTDVTLNPVMRLAYLVPRGGKCVLDFSYMGLVSMLKSNGNIKTLDAHIVFEDEEFNYDPVNNTIHHIPSFATTEAEHNARQIKGAYSRAVLSSGEIVFEFMPYWEIEKVKKQSPSSNSKHSVWVTWRDEMIKKTVIKRHFKMLISLNGQAKSPQLSAVMEVENENSEVKPISNNSDKPSLRNAFQEVEEVTEKPDTSKEVDEIIQFTEHPTPEEPEVLSLDEDDADLISDEMAEEIQSEIDADKQLPK